MFSTSMVFFVELMSYRLGSKLAESLAYDPHLGGHHHAAEHNGTPSSHAGAARPGSVEAGSGKEHDHASDDFGNEGGQQDLELSRTHSTSVDSVSASAAASQILGVMILEFGVIFHSVIIGITLGSTNDFTTLFIVIIFHQAFEGLGLGARLAFLPLKPNSPIPYLAGLAYACVTPIGLAIGLGIRQTYNQDSATANYVTGVFDSVSAGILLYAGLVELLAHEFIFNDKMRKAPIGKVLLAVAEMWLGAGIMALLARWA